jgi:uncharacterized membrane protein
MPSVHFPIALITFAFIAELLFMLTGRESFKTVLRFCLWMGLLTAVPTVALGWARATHGSFAGDLTQWTLFFHRWLGVATVSVAFLCAIACEVRARSDGPRTRLVARIALAIGALLVGATGAFGGALVYGWEHYAW